MASTVDAAALSGGVTRSRSTVFRVKAAKMAVIQLHLCLAPLPRRLLKASPFSDHRQPLERHQQPAPLRLMARAVLIMAALYAATGISEVVTPCMVSAVTRVRTAEMAVSQDLAQKHLWPQRQDLLPLHRIQIRDLSR